MKVVQPVLISLMLLSSLACSHGGPKVEGKELFEKVPSLYNRFVEYWRARAFLDADKSFSLEAPYIQLVYNRGNYKGFVNWFKNSELVAIKVERVVCEKEFYCCVDMKMVYKVKKDNRQEVFDGHDCWVKAGGVWWHNMRNPLVGPLI